MKKTSSKGLKLISIATAVLMVIVVLSMTAFAEGKDLLKIDNEKVYDGMNQSYKDGYSPVQTGDNVEVVLPLIPADAASTTQVSGGITVTPNLGDASSSPFVFKNYQKTVTWAVHSSNTGSSEAYLVQFTLPLSKDRMMGRYPIVFDVSYATTEGEQIQQQFSVYVEVDGKDPNPKPTQEPTPAPRSQPKLIISSYNIAPEVVQAGEAFTVTATLQNTSEKYDARNIKVTYSGDGENILPADHTNTQYIKKIKDEENHELTFDMKARLDSAPGIQKVTLNIEYEDSQTNSYTLADEILLQVTQPLNVEMDEPNIPKTANAGDSIPITLNLFNKGRSKVYNVMCKLDAPGLIPEGSAFIGNMEPGSSGNAEMYVFVGTLNMSASEDGNMETDRQSDERYGYTSGTISITYEDEFGEEYSKEINFDMDIQAPVIEVNTEPEVEEEKDTVSQWWISVAIAVVIIAGLTAIIIVQKKRKAKAFGDSDGLD